MLSDRVHWSWVLPLLLLAAALSGSLLDFRAFEADEAASSLQSGLHRQHPLFLREVVVRTIALWPDQAVGYPVLLAAWGRVAGGSEVALRALSWFGGLLTLALTWRAGREIYGGGQGLLQPR